MKREQIHGTSPMDIKKINDNTMNLWEKVNGNINFNDFSRGAKSEVRTRWLPFNEEDNLDASNPLLVRIYIPPNVKEIKEAKLSVQCSNFRMDSSITASDGAIANGQVNLSLASSDVAIGQAGAGGGGYFNVTFPVEKWGTSPYQFNAPTKYCGAGTITKPSGSDPSGGFVQGVAGSLGTIHGGGTYSGLPIEFSDFKNFQHQHRVVLDAHTHPISVSTQPHSHSGSASVNIPGHQHKLNPGIFVSDQAPVNMRIAVNDTAVGTFLDGNNKVQNDIDISRQLKIGQWNIIKITANNASRATVFGVVNLVENT